MSEHTPEPWYRNDLIAGQGSVILAGASHRKRLDADGRFTKEDARRIVACVNACGGIDTEALEVVEIGKRPFDVILRERDEARARVKELLELVKEGHLWDGVEREDCPTCSAIVRAEAIYG